MPKKWDLTGLRDMPPGEIVSLLDEAEALLPRVANPALRGGPFQGRAVCVLMYEDSTRTKMSFMAAADYLGARAYDMGVATSSVNKGESLADTAKNLGAMGFDAFVIRHKSAGAAALFAQNVAAGVINGGDGNNEHPSQALYDLFTIRRHKGGFDGLKVAIVGDISHSRVARSNLFALAKLGAKVTLCAPSTLQARGLSAYGAALTSDPREAACGADVLMGLRVQLERGAAAAFPSLGEYREFFGITPEIMALAKPDAILMHPGPMNRGVELSAEVIDSERSVIYEQVTNGVAVRAAILARAMGGSLCPR